jgi:OmcA/MtrC family decaheme c-type cytochrome
VITACLIHPAVGWSADGLVVTIERVGINNQLKPEVTFRMVDNVGQAVKLRGDDQLPEDVSARFILAKLNASADGSRGTSYTSYMTRIQTVPAGEPNAGVSAVQATLESGGSFSEVGDGRYTYTFGPALPVDYDRNLTHTVSGQFERTVDGVRYVANPVYHFVPNGNEVTILKRVSTTESCNTCHTNLGLHGGARMEYQYCILCHNPQSTDPDTGNTVDMGVMIHKIHMGADLPSVQAGNPYIIVGNRQSVHDYSHVVFPQDHRNCVACHNGPEGDVYKTAPSRMACGSCHDNINFQTGEGHGPGLPQADDRQCAICHVPDGSEFGLSISGSHTIPTQSTRLNGIIAEIKDIRNAAPGQAPSVLYTLRDKNGSPIDIAGLSSLALTYAGTTTEYSTYTRESANTASVVEGDALRYTFTRPIAADAAGTFGFAIEARRNVTLVDNPEGEVDVVVTEGARNAIQFASLSGGPVENRRQIVDEEKCNACHGALSFHGSQRNRVEFCVMCHNPNVSDKARRPEGVQGGESISFGYMIHKIHTGHELTQPYVVYGFGNVAHDYSHVLFPGQRQECTICHTQQPTLPLPAGVASINFVNKEGQQVNIPATIAICGSCHDGVNFQTGEGHGPGIPQFNDSACFACHGPGMYTDIAKYHKLNTALNVEVTHGVGSVQVQRWLLH